MPNIAIKNINRIKIRCALYLFRRRRLAIAAFLKNLIPFILTSLGFIFVLQAYKDDPSSVVRIAKPVTAFLAIFYQLTDSYFLLKRYKRRFELFDLKRKYKKKNNKE